MRQSLKTRLLSAAYKAACAFAEKVFAFTESIREKKDDSYLDALYDYRDALAEELRAGEELASALALRNSRVEDALARTERMIWPDCTPTCTLHKVQDFADLPAPQGVDENEAPDGYKAVDGGGCVTCAFDPLGACPAPACFSGNRGDGQEVVFVAR
jgi:hypothetical protein